MATEPTEDNAKKKLNEQADTLGIKRSKISLVSSKIKDREMEAAKQKELSDARVAARVKKAKAKPLTAMKARKQLLEARRTHPQDYTPAQRRQAKFELDLMDQKTWTPGHNVTTKKAAAGRIAPKKGKTTYQQIMGE